MNFVGTQPAKVLKQKASITSAGFFFGPFAAIDREGENQARMPDLIAKPDPKTSPPSMKESP